MDVRKKNSNSFFFNTRSYEISNFDKEGFFKLLHIKLGAHGAFNSIIYLSISTSIMIQFYKRIEPIF